MRSRGFQAQWLLILALWVGWAGCSDDPRPPDYRVDAGVDGAGDFQLADGPAACSLQWSSLNGKAPGTVTSLSGADDQDSNLPGIQLEVEVSGENLANGAEVKLNVTGLAEDLTAIASGGKALFSGVTVGADLTAVVLRVSSTDCAAPPPLPLPVEPPPECEFLAPKDGTGLGKAQDKNPATPALDYDVQIFTKNAGTGQVVLYIDNAAQPAKQPDSFGKVVYADTILPEGKLELRAEVSVGQVKRSCVAKIEVATGAPQCKLLGFNPAPQPLDGGGSGLGIAQDAQPATAGVETNVEVQSEDGNQVTLQIDGLVWKTVASNGGVANFDLVPLSDGSRVVSASCVHPTAGGSAQSQSATVLVDSKAPEAIDDLSCTLLSNREGKVSCSWTAKGDPTPEPSGTQLVQIRYTAGTPLTAANWATATQLGEVPPFTSGTARTATFSGLRLGLTYFIGLKVLDRVKNASALATASGGGLLVDFKSQERTLSATDVPEAAGIGAVMASGDFDCDGKTDLAIGQPAVDGEMGKVFIYLGTATGLLQNPTKILSGSVTGGRFGAGLAALPNFDGDADKCHDLAVFASHGDSSLGRVFIYLGRKLFFDRTDLATGTGAELILQLPAAAPSTQRLGTALASAGDFDNDGATDLLLSFHDTSNDTASVLVVYGIKGQTLMTTGVDPTTIELPAGAGVEVGPGKLSEGFGLSLGDGARLDADDFAELLIGAKATEVGGNTRGAVHVVLGGARSGTLPESLPLSSGRVVTISGGGNNAAFGASLGFVGDMNKDGKRELAVGDPAAASGAGAVYLFNLESSPSSVADAAGVVQNDLPGATTGNAFGTVIVGAGNVDPELGGHLNMDAYADLVAGAQTKGTSGVGAAFQINGAMGALTGLSTSAAGYVWSGPAAAPSFGQRVIFVKDLNGDGFLDLAIGDPLANSGRGRFFIYF